MIKTLPLLSAISATLLLSACGSQGTKDSSSTGSNTVAEPSGETIVLWNGDTPAYNTSWAPGGWAHANDASIDSVTLEQQSGVGYQGSNGLKVEAAGSKWMGIGWNWMGAWEGDTGMDLSNYSAIGFKIRIDGEKLFGPNEGVAVHFNSGGPTKNNMSQSFKVEQFANGNIQDGEWHMVTVPLTQVVGTTMGGDSGPFNITKVRELDLGLNTQGYIDLNVYIDDIVAIR